MTGVMVVERKDLLKRRGHKSIPQFERAIDNLQNHEYITELWVENSIVTLRWVKKDSRWHVTYRGAPSVVDVLVHLSNQALMWIAAVDRKQGNESNYAVREV